MKTSADERAIIDTNVLVYAADVRAPQYAAAQALRDAAARGEFTAYLTTQIVLEFVSIVTSPKRVASPRRVAEAWAEIRRLTTAFPVLTFEDDDIRAVAQLSEDLGVKGGAPRHARPRRREAPSWLRRLRRHQPQRLADGLDRRCHRRRERGADGAGPGTVPSALELAAVTRRESWGGG
jgi:predicted nucleic acid-binding protein